jgi:hypothetical protein
LRIVYSRIGDSSGVCRGNRALSPILGAGVSCVGHFDVELRISPDINDTQQQKQQRGQEQSHFQQAGPSFRCAAKPG